MNTVPSSIIVAYILEQQEETFFYKGRDKNILSLGPIRSLSQLLNPAFIIEVCHRQHVN